VIDIFLGGLRDILSVFKTVSKSRDHEQSLFLLESPISDAFSQASNFFLRERPVDVTGIKADDKFVVGHGHDVYREELRDVDVENSLIVLVRCLLLSS